ncbi:MAG: cyclic nucleotide-binding domain-containing protein, partial [SAR202 cluster bacterium]|nr:cyclic nucleotide-binding domain-containing protein [SAR202 cluster bacterium]
RSAWRRFVPNEQILDRMSANQEVFFVVEGAVRVVNYSLTGREVAYATVRAGGYFGELAAIDGEPRSASVVATENCLLVKLPPNVFI